MPRPDAATYPVVRPPETLDVFLLSRVELAAAIALQQQFAQEVLQTPGHRSILLLCEHAPIWSSGTAPLEWSLQETLPASAREALPVPRAGGLLEHGPAQLAVLPVFSLGLLEQTPLGFTHTLEQIVTQVCRSAGAPEVICSQGLGVHCRTGWLARTALQFTGDISQFGCYLNVGQTYQLHPTEKSSSLAIATMQHKELSATKALVLDEFSHWLPETRQQVFTRHPLLKRTWQNPGRGER
jgi:lipoate-protein ligase B